MEDASAEARHGENEVRIQAHYAAHAWLLPLGRRELARLLRVMLRALDENGAPAPDRLELHLLDDAAMSVANLRFMGCMGPTNILSFPGGESLPGILLLSLDTLARECLLYGQEPAEHLARLLSHGMGHLAGLDHGVAMDRLCAACFAAARRAATL
ncbi:rRNA maturation RNase YbeY [Desulfovibrio sp. SGI.169]|uniref:rRNA maturation RNase YbeY n=1 Tax=Desulfovibrio sp. SGI.169 TaxID=3420561 RepID=UPI003CFBDDC4